MSGNQFFSKIKLPVLALALLVGAFSAEAAEDGLAGGRRSSEIEKDTILIGDQIRWSLDIDASNFGEGDVLFVPEDAPAHLQGIEFIGGVSLDSVALKRRLPQVKASAVITSFDSGSYALPPFPLYLRRADGTTDTLDCGAPSLHVMTIPVDTASFTPYDIKGQIKAPVTFREVFPWIAGVIVLLLVAYLVYRLIKRSSASKAGVSQAPADPPHITALRRLEETRNRKLWQQGKEKLYYTEITDTLREYIERRYSISAMESTSNEILTELSSKNLTPEQYAELSELFRLSDLVKFAKYKADQSENENAIPVAVRFVNSTFEDKLTEEKRG